MRYDFIYDNDDHDNLVEIIPYCEACGIDAGLDAYPCGIETDYPEFCLDCGDPVGNPLTSDGVTYCQELAARGPYGPELRDAYPYIFTDWSD